MRLRRRFDMGARKLIRAALAACLMLAATACALPVLAQTVATTPAAQSAFDRFVADMKLPVSIYSRVDPQAEVLVAQGLKPVLTGTIPEWAFIERLGTIERQQWREKATLDGQGGSWAAAMRANGAGPQFTMRLLMARGPASPSERIELTYWALRNFPEEWDSRTEALLSEMGGGGSLIDVGAIRAALDQIRAGEATARRIASP